MEALVLGVVSFLEDARDMWIENYLEEIRERTERDMAEVGRETLERETEGEVEAKVAVKH